MSKSFQIDRIHAAVFLVAVLVAGTFILTQTEGSASLPKEPVHWHPKLTIYVDGEQQVIPANIGIGSTYASHPYYDRHMEMTGIHTHATDGILHWEMMHAPQKVEDLQLGTFFQIWGQRFDSQCIFDFCNGGGKTVQIFVNGERNYDYEKYVVADGDDIVIRYE